uniref:Uncharacterized protein n=1 Tax=Parascaris equorum TaxID=6256 RepID=A0A914S4H2_PAREQ
FIGVVCKDALTAVIGQRVFASVPHTYIRVCEHHRGEVMAVCLLRRHSCSLAKKGLNVWLRNLVTLFIHLWHQLSTLSWECLYGSVDLSCSVNELNLQISELQGVFSPVSHEILAQLKYEPLVIYSLLFSVNL